MKEPPMHGHRSMKQLETPDHGFMGELAHPEPTLWLQVSPYQAWLSESLKAATHPLPVDSS